MEEGFPESPSEAVDSRLHDRVPDTLFGANLMGDAGARASGWRVTSPSRPRPSQGLCEQASPAKRFGSKTDLLQGERPACLPRFAGRQSANQRPGPVGIPTSAGSSTGAIMAVAGPRTRDYEFAVSSTADRAGGSTGDDAASCDDPGFGGRPCSPATARRSTRARSTAFRPRVQKKLTETGARAWAARRSTISCANWLLSRAAFWRRAVPRAATSWSRWGNLPAEMMRCDSARGVAVICPDLKEVRNPRQPRVRAGAGSQDWALPAVDARRTRAKPTPAPVAVVFFFWVLLVPTALSIRENDQAWVDRQGGKRPGLAVDI